METLRNLWLLPPEPQPFPVQGTTTIYGVLDDMDVKIYVDGYYTENGFDGDWEFVDIPEVPEEDWQELIYQIERELAKKEF